MGSNWKLLHQAISLFLLAGIMAGCSAALMMVGGAESHQEDCRYSLGEMVLCPMVPEDATRIVGALATFTLVAALVLLALVPNKGEAWMQLILAPPLPQWVRCKAVRKVALYVQLLSQGIVHPKVP